MFGREKPGPARYRVNRATWPCKRQSGGADRDDAGRPRRPCRSTRRHPSSGQPGSHPRSTRIAPRSDRQKDKVRVSLVQKIDPRTRGYVDFAEPDPVRNGAFPQLGLRDVSPGLLTKLVARSVGRFTTQAATDSRAQPNADVVNRKRTRN
jgi:hypothetical protein